MLRSNVMLCYNTAKQIYRIRNVNIKYLLYKSLPIAHRISKNTFCLLAPMSNLILFCQHLFCGVRSCKPLHFANQRRICCGIKHRKINIWKIRPKMFALCCIWRRNISEGAQHPYTFHFGGCSPPCWPASLVFQTEWESHLPSVPLQWRMVSGPP